ncbi:hypothetical protein PENTCL1PPCAC_19542 [Pristionchus entomophagus]|uniref:Uncharacterized protein n=1 Tax=Pristionchus entomophagus TaxID=358040 RepID=A0AAV5TT51_9BILA|nr:hypothetical protein PENTCL1PPCAC_19542 [Pristionchus entomophagus]
MLKMRKGERGMPTRLGYLKSEFDHCKYPYLFRSIANCSSTLYSIYLNDYSGEAMMYLSE